MTHIFPNKLISKYKSKPDCMILPNSELKINPNIKKKKKKEGN
uniref:Uncharacterized protein n=1 Tax=Rhizophora mucronata TaxID=61149 RepID=A0A2P2MPE1_RHIMU